MLECQIAHERTPAGDLRYLVCTKIHTQPVGFTFSGTFLLFAFGGPSATGPLLR